MVFNDFWKSNFIRTPFILSCVGCESGFRNLFLALSSARNSISNWQRARQALTVLLLLEPLYVRLRQGEACSQWGGGRYWRSHENLPGLHHDESVSHLH